MLVYGFVYSFGRLGVRVNVPFLPRVSAAIAGVDCLRIGYVRLSDWSGGTDGKMSG